MLQSFSHYSAFVLAYGNFPRGLCMNIDIHDVRILALDKEKLPIFFNKLVAYTSEDGATKIWLYQDIERNVVYGCVIRFTGAKKDIDMNFADDDTINVMNINKHTLNYFMFSLTSGAGRYLSYHGSISLGNFSKLASFIAVENKLLDKKKRNDFVSALTDDNSLSSYIEHTAALKCLKLKDGDATSFINDATVEGMVVKEITLKVDVKEKSLIEKICDFFGEKGVKAVLELDNGKTKTISLDEPKPYSTIDTVDYNDFMDEVKKYNKKENFHQNCYLVSFAKAL